MAILIALAFGLLFLLVAMVVNIGFLVAAKINLQNATDLAAYAGAAQQARYLTEIGKWNYEMRRNYKAMSYDYMIVLNGERRYNKTVATDRDFKDYILTGTDKPKGIPWVCATLQRQGTASTPSLTKECQNIAPLDFQTAINNSANALTQSGQAVSAACGPGGDPTTCQSVTNAAMQQAAAQFSLTQTTTGVDGKLANYEKYPYNYNRRLIGWMLHDYRHLQTRIRGVHIGDISLGQYNNGNPFANSSGRWALKKDKNPTIFKNSPISVAAKVINGYTQTDGTAAPSGVIAVKEGDNLKNPVNNAAYGTFKKNLMEVLYDSAKLYTLVPKSTASDSCNGNCPEYAGPYLKLDNHDVDFWVTYTLIQQPTAGISQYKYNINMENVTNFPVGVAKDMRLATYYTVVGTASTKKIPFNVFFGSSETSQDATMVAVAAARPFGSRIGPFVNDDCKSLYGGSGSNQALCLKNGLDPLYPFESSGGQVQDKVPNFSLGSEDGTQKLGVKLCVDKTEYGKVLGPLPLGATNAHQDNADYHTNLYQIGSGLLSRFRTYTKAGPGGSMDGDDGFPNRLTPASKNPGPNAYYDSDDNPTHPFGTKDSVVAWNGATTVKPLDAAKKKNYETYLENYFGPATYQFGTQIDGRESDDGQPYKVYVFRYPDPNTNSNEWKITNVPDSGEDAKLEKSFANAMAVNMFEIARYIIPYRNTAGTNQQGGTPVDVLNYVASAANNKALIFGGLTSTDRDTAPFGKGNIQFAGPSDSGPNNMIKEDAGEVLGVNSAGDIFPETFTAWRFGSRGYRVKLVNVQDLISANGSAKFQNPLENSYKLPDSDITVDLSNIKY